jgi:hypothetical protein
MGEVVNFPGNDETTEQFEAYIRRCGKPAPFGDAVCAEPAGHSGGHVSAADRFGNATGWPAGLEDKQQ